MFANETTKDACLHHLSSQESVTTPT